MRKEKRENKDFKKEASWARVGCLKQGGGVCNPLTNYMNFLDRAVINKCK